jgi:hypothetical protein
MSLTSRKKGLVLYPKGDGPQEQYFAVMARRFKRAHVHSSIALEDFDEYDSTEFLADLNKATHQGLDILAYIGHGTSDSLLSASVGSDTEVGGLVDRIRTACNDGASIILYACNCGSLSESLLNKIHRETLPKKFSLYGHNSSGPAAGNPDKTIFPPDGGAMLIDQVLGPLAKARRFETAWRQAMGNEWGDLWATFFLLSNEELLQRTCGSVIRGAASANRRLMKDVGWDQELDRIYQFLGIAERNEEKLALGIARWQVNYFGGDEADGRLGTNSWRAMRPQIDAWSQRQLNARPPGYTRYGPNP